MKPLRLGIALFSAVLLLPGCTERAEPAELHAENVADTGPASALGISAGPITEAQARAIAARAAGGTVTAVREGDEDGTDAFEVDVATAAGTRSVIVRVSDGAVLETEAPKAEGTASGPRAEAAEENDEGSEAAEGAEAVQTPLPAAISAAFRQAYPRARILGSSRETKDGQVVYEVESMDGTQRRDLIYRPDGTVVEYEEVIATSALPAAVAAAFRAQRAGRAVSAERLVRGAETRYELIVGRGRAQREYVFAADGRVIETPASARAEADEEGEDGEGDEGREAPEGSEIRSATLPAAISAAFRRAYPHARILGSSQEQKDGQPAYEVESQDGAQRRDLIYRPDGTVVEYEEVIATSALPAAVSRAVAAQHAGAATRAERLVQGSEIRYEVVTGRGRAQHTFVFAADGRVIESPSTPKD